MLVYVLVSRTEDGEKEILGVSLEYNDAVKRAWEYAMEYPDEENWIEQLDTEDWGYTPTEEYRMFHRTRISKINGLSSHVIVLSKENLLTVTESDEWYVVNTESTSFDKIEGQRRNQKILHEYLKKQREMIE